MNRSKRIPVTDTLLDQIERVTGTSVSPESIAIFEAAAYNTRPISKRGSIFQGSVASRSLLEQMNERLNDGSESVPLHTLHQQGFEMPVGRVFQTELRREYDDELTLVSMFYLPSSEAELIQKIELGVIDEVSVGLKAKHAYCSKCGFDYFGPEADFTHLFSQTCENGHTIGEDGTHLKLVDLDYWTELSLVSRGAAQQPKILSRAKFSLPEGAYEKMAAEGKPAEATILYTSIQGETPSMDPEIIKQALAEALEAQIGTRDTQITELGTQVGDLTAQLAAKDQEIEDLKAQLEAATAEPDPAPEPEPEPDPAPQITGIPEGGLAASAITDAKKVNASFGAAAFKTARK